MVFYRTEAYETAKREAEDLPLVDLRSQVTQYERQYNGLLSKIFPPAKLRASREVLGRRAMERFIELVADVD